LRIAHTRLLLQRGQILAAAVEVGESDDPSLPLGEREQAILLRARIHGLLQGDKDSPSDWLGHLERVRAQAQGEGRMGCVIEALVLIAGIHQSANRAESAIQALREALALAEPDGFVRTVTDAGEPLMPLLDKIAGHPEGTDPRYAATLLSAFKAPSKVPALTGAAAAVSTTTLSEPVTSREVEVLQLVAAGLSNAQIADRMYLSTGTIKRHLYNIFTKLDVDSRLSAVRRAQELGLL
jgi:LuxR family maltose regulon positive regulatory protein